MGDFMHLQNLANDMLSGKAPNVAPNPQVLQGLQSVPMQAAKPTMSNFKMSGLFLILTTIALAFGIVYLITRIRKQDRIIKELSSEISQQVNDDDVTTIIKQFLTRPDNHQFISNAVLPTLPLEQLSQHISQQVSQNVFSQLAGEEVENSEPVNVEPEDSTDTEARKKRKQSE